MAKSNYSYKEAQTELEKIVNDVAEGKTPIDALVDKLKRANELVAVCQNKLRDTEGEIKKMTAKK